MVFDTDSVTAFLRANFCGSIAGKKAMVHEAAVVLFTEGKTTAEIVVALQEQFPKLRLWNDPHCPKHTGAPLAVSYEEAA